MAASVATALRGHAGTEYGREPLEIGAGGDRTARVDRIAEDAILEACERLAAGGERFTLRSEEVGERLFGAPWPVLLVDPVDGSLNAMFGIPYFCTSLALLDGPTLGDVAVGVVRNLAGVGVYSAVRGGGAWRDDIPLEPLAVGLGDGDRIPMLVLEAHRGVGRQTGARVDMTGLLAAATRIRLMGSSALSLCMAAVGSASAIVAPDGMRAYDCAAGLVILRECGGVVTDLDGQSIAGRAAAFAERTSLVGSLSTAVHARVLGLMQ